MYPLDFVRCRRGAACTVFEFGNPNGDQNPKTAGLRLCLPNSKTAIAGAPAATDKSNGYIEYEALHHHLDMCSYVETQAITHIAFSLPCRLC